jgi:hypothetical protein
MPVAWTFFGMKFGKLFKDHFEFRLTAIDCFDGQANNAMFKQ